MPCALKPDGRCKTCGRRHTEWYTLARCTLAPWSWTSGNGRFASVSDCPRGRTVIMFRTRAAAEKAKAFIDKGSCGGVCERQHRVVDLDGLMTAAPENPATRGPVITIGPVTMADAEDATPATCV